MLIREFISETNKNQMIATILKHYKVGGVRIKYKSMKDFAHYEVDDGVLLEDGTGESSGSLIILNGTDSSSSDAGFKLLLQVDEDEILLNPRVFLMESSNIFPSEGSIPLSNFTLNSINSGYDPVTHSSVITLRETGDIALEDGTDTEDSSNGFLLEETNGDNIDLEGATGITP